MSLHKTSFLIYLSFIGCIPSQNEWQRNDVANVVIDDPEGKFSQGDIENIQLAFQEWQQALTDNQGSYITFRFISINEADSNVIKISTFSYDEMSKQCFYPDEQLTLKEQEGACELLGKTEISPFKKGGEILVPYDVNPMILHIILLHEIGHALNLQHENMTIMEPYGFNHRNIGCQDVKQFCKVNECETFNFSICAKK